MEAELNAMADEWLRNLLVNFILFPGSTREEKISLY